MVCDQQICKRSTAKKTIDFFRLFIVLIPLDLLDYSKIEFAPAVAISWSCSIVPPLTPIAPIIFPPSFFKGTPPGKVMSPSLESSML